MEASGHIPEAPEAAACRVLSLDGGGSKGFYTLGVLKEIEAMVGPLHERFDLIFGTSTGSIIAALLALGNDVDKVHDLYRAHVPAVMRAGSRSAKSAALKHLAESIFEDARFEDVRTKVGIVTTRWHFETPMIFKGDATQAHGRHSTFVPGFGCPISEAVQASCAAYPFFEKKTIETSDKETIELIDGGYCANNPTLYAIADALMALGSRSHDLRVVSVGVGTYPEPKKYGWPWLKGRLPSVKLAHKTLNVNIQSMEQLRKLLFKNVPTVRISDTFAEPDMATDFLEHDLEKLDRLYQRGRKSFEAYEAQLKEILA